MADLNYLKELSGDDPDFLKDIAGTFIVQAPQFCVNLKQYAETRRFGHLEREAHSAKSTAIILGLNELTSMLGELEELAANQEKTELYPDMISRIENEFKIAIEEISLLVGRISGR